MAGTIPAILPIPAVPPVAPRACRGRGMAAMNRVVGGLAGGHVHAYWAGIAALLLVALLWLAFGRRRRLSPRRRVRLAIRQDANGRRLLQMARELDQHARELRRMGMPAQQAHRWASQCRTLAAAHLACINALLLDPRVTREIIQGEDGDRRLM